MYNALDVKCGSKEVNYSIESNDFETVLRRGNTFNQSVDSNIHPDIHEWSIPQYYQAFEENFQKNDVILLVENNKGKLFFFIFDLNCLPERTTTPHTKTLPESKLGKTLMVIDHEQLESCFPHAPFLLDTSDNEPAHNLPKFGNVKPTNLLIDLSKLPLPHQQTDYQGTHFSAREMLPFPFDINPSYIAGSSSQARLPPIDSIFSGANTFPAILSNFPHCAYNAERNRDPSAAIPPQPPIAGSSPIVSVATESASAIDEEPLEVDKPASILVTASTEQASMASGSRSLSRKLPYRPRKRKITLPVIEDPDSIFPRCITCNEGAKRKGWKYHSKGIDSLFKYTCHHAHCNTSFFANLKKFIVERSEAEIDEGIDSNAKEKSVTCACGLKALIKDLQPIGVGTNKSPTQKYKCKDLHCTNEISDPTTGKLSGIWLNQRSKILLEI